MYNQIESIEIVDLNNFLRSNPNSLLVDIRETFELDKGKINWKHWTHIPFGQFLLSFTTLPLDVPVIVYCEHGNRSYMAVQYLGSVLSKGRFINLKGGFSEFQDLSTEIKPEIN